MIDGGETWEMHQPGFLKYLRTNLMYAFIQRDSKEKKKHYECRGSLQKEVEEDKREKD